MAHCSFTAYYSHPDHCGISILITAQTCKSGVLWHKWGFCIFRGLDNAGKTTIVKKIAGLDISQVSPTLGFQIHSLQFKGYDIATVITPHIVG